MKTRTFGCIGRQVSVVGQGTWRIQADEHAAALRRGIDLGLTHIDTAEFYGDGQSEKVVAKAIDGRREEVFLATKVSPQNASREGTIAACERSLARLQTDHIDLFLLHAPGAIQFAETLAGFEALREQGKILAFGVCNFDAAQLREALALTHSIACVQTLYHLEDRSTEHALIPLCEERGVAVVAFSPFGSGAFPSPHSKGGRVLARLASERRTTPRVIALSFLGRRAFVIPRTASVEHVAENATATELSDEEARQIEEAFPHGAKAALRSELGVLRRLEDGVRRGHSAEVEAALRAMDRMRWG